MIKTVNKKWENDTELTTTTSTTQGSLNPIKVASKARNQADPSK
jgi:hypothetical protein